MECTEHLTNANSRLCCCSRGLPSQHRAFTSRSRVGIALSPVSRPTSCVSVTVCLRQHLLHPCACGQIFVGDGGGSPTQSRSCACPFLCCWIRPPRTSNTSASASRRCLDLRVLGTHLAQRRQHWLWCCRCSSVVGARAINSKMTTEIPRTVVARRSSRARWCLAASACTCMPEQLPLCWRRLATPYRKERARCATTSLHG